MPVEASVAASFWPTSPALPMPVCPGEAVPDQLQHQVRRGPEAGEAQGLAVLQPGQAERAEPDRPRAHQGRGLYVGEGVRDRVRERLGHGHQLGVTAVGVAARGPEPLAEVFLPPPARAQCSHAE